MTPETRAKWMASRVKHGGYLGGKEHSEHAIWRGILSRCMNPNSKDYPRYGGRGITVCERWRIYENFISDMGPRPKGYSVERKDNEIGYSPDNCVWADSFTQQRNKRDNVYFEQDGEVLTLTEWARLLDISKELAHWRMKNWGTFVKGQAWQRRNRK